MPCPIRIRLSTLLPLLAAPVVLLIAAYVQWALFGLPTVPAAPHFTANTAMQPYGFAAWIRVTHYVNLLFMVLLIRSGLQILMDRHDSCSFQKGFVLVRSLDSAATDQHEAFRSNGRRGRRLRRESRLARAP